MSVDLSGLPYTKAGAICSGFTVEILWARFVATLVFLKYGLDCILTSGRDSRHMLYSFHYSGNAIDLRVRHIPGTLAERRKIAQEIASAIRKCLGEDYQVKFEFYTNPNNDHIHIQSKPKRPAVYGPSRKPSPKVKHV